MSDHTQWYNLDLYEGNDKPNLLDQYNTSMDKIDTALKGLQTQIHGGADIEDLEQRIYSLEHANHNFFEGKNIVFVGDSFSTGYGCSDYDTLRTKRFTSLVCQWLGATEYNYAVGSTGFIAVGASMGHNDPFLTQVQTAADSMTQTEKDNTAAVVIAGGINDAVGNPTYLQMRNACYAVVNLAASLFPNARIVLVPMMFKGFAFSLKAHECYNALVDGATATRKCAIVKGAYTWNWGDSAKFNSDKLHPNDSGYATIACNIACALLFGQLDAWEDHIYDLTYPSSGNFAPSSNARNTVMIKQGVVYVNPCAIHSDAAVSSNTACAVLPNSCAPLTYQFGVAGTSSNHMLGVIGLTTLGLVYLNPFNESVAANGGFFISALVYDLYGKDYNA